MDGVEMPEKNPEEESAAKEEQPENMDESTKDDEMADPITDSSNTLPSTGDEVVSSEGKESPSFLSETAAASVEEPSVSEPAVKQEEEPQTITEEHTPVEAELREQSVTATGSEQEGDIKIRRSTRDIKRPKFDDELVDSGIGLHSPSPKRRLSERSNSVFSTDGMGLPLPAASTSGLTIDTSMASVQSAASGSAEPSPMTFSPVTWGGKINKVGHPESTKPAKRHDLRQRTNMISLKDRMAMDDALQEEEAARIERKRRESRIASKDIRAKEIAAAHEAAEASNIELNDWTAEDDVALVTAITHIGDIEAVHRSIIFSKDYTVPEMEERWYQLMYDDALSRQAKKRMQELPPDVVLKIQSKTVFSEREEELLREVRPVQNPSLELMGELVRDHQEEFHSARTPQILLDHWHMMLRNQVIDKPAPSTIPFKYERFEKNTAICGANVMSNPLKAANELNQLGTKLGKVGVQPVAGIVSDAQLGPGAVATLNGKVVRYVLRRDHLPVILGRNTTESAVDVNLALEGPSSKISRKQAQITMEANGEFWLKNLSPSSVVVDGRKVDEGLKTRLNNNVIIEFGIIKLTFRLANVTPRAQTYK